MKSRKPDLDSGTSSKPETRSSKLGTGNLHSALGLIQDRIRDLRENTDFVSTLFENLIGYAIIAADFDGNILAYNEGAHQIYGYAPEEIIGTRTLDSLFPDEVVAGGTLQRMIGDLIEKGRFSYEGEKLRKDGERFPARILFTVTKDKAGKVVGLIEIAEDLTERKRAEEALLEAKNYTDAIIRNFLDTLIAVDSEAKIRTINPETCKLLGYTEGELIGQPAGKIFEEKEEARRFFQFFRHGDRSTIHEHMELRNIELTYRAKYGRRIPMLFNASVLTDEAGNVTGVVAGAKDISDMKHAEEARAEEQARRIRALEQEIRNLDSLAKDKGTHVTSRLFGGASFRETAPHIAAEIDAEYGAILDQALVQRAYKAENLSSELIRATATRLGRLRATPRDVVEIHTQALRERLKSATPQKTTAYIEEGRLLVLEVMGQLASFYRVRAVPSVVSLPSNSDRAKTPEEEPSHG